MVEENRAPKAHLLAFFVAAGAAAVNTQANAVADPLYAAPNSRFQPYEDIDIFAAFASGATILRSRIVTGELQAIAPQQIFPLNGALLPASNPNIQDLRDHPISLKAEQEIAVQVSNSGAGENQYGLLWIAQKGFNFNLPMGPRRRIRATATITTTANAWSALNALTLDDTLPPGKYAVVGFAAQAAANGVAARLVLPSNPTYRSGCLAQANIVDVPHPMFQGGIGVHGYFWAYSLPQVEVLANAAAATAWVFWLDVIKVG